MPETPENPAKPSLTDVNSSTAAPDGVLTQGTKFSLHAREFFYSIAEWERIDLDTPDHGVLIGTPSNPIIRPGTKNIVEAPEKSFKTTMLLRLAIGMACGHTVYPSLPVARKVRVLYVHGEMTPKELAERRKAACFQIPEEAMAVGRKEFIDGRCITAHLIDEGGQGDIRRVVKEHNPDVLMLDPWQSFITGFDENTFKDVSQALHFLDTLIADQRGMTIFLVVHLGKNRDRGARGHSSLSGWRDTLIRLTNKSPNSIKVDVHPRWGNPVVFKLHFDNGTLTEGKPFSPQSAKVRSFLEEKNDWVSRAEIEQFLGSNKEAAKKAIQRAVDEQAIRAGSGANLNKFVPHCEDDEGWDGPF